ncbi:TetR/AcrR family transcriptional regulator [uncultured Ruminococcus sp.]|uniref:TetR/AcrR family transcriptional regulator n=1 Tax=uncultured Ruminococcus sp. TaxID=165186 RepID=UPI000EBDF94F|nr:TetR/AcrR family transcriptional regulator [uncultured Ruminococcus sp.]HCJ40522.1 hypothetical protein [Ruminococcus sp.]
MPQGPRVAEDRILAATLDIIREQGLENLNVRGIAARIGCSTQPIMYRYKSVNVLLEHIYNSVADMHRKFITGCADKPLTLIGAALAHIRFAEKEKHLFRFLFQTVQFKNDFFEQLTSMDETAVMIETLCQQSKLSGEQGMKVLRTLMTCAHGAASLTANGSVGYDETALAEMLESTLNGAVSCVKEGR